MIKLLILGLLAQNGISYPYELLQLVKKRHYDAFITVTKGSFYYNVDALEAAGDIEVVAYSPTKNAFVSKTSYQITAQGKQTFASLSVQYLKQPDKGQSPSKVGLLFADQIEPTVLQAALTQHISQLKADCSVLAVAIKEAPTAGLAAELLTHKLQVQQAEISWYQNIKEKVSK
ncbi:PadR family transcriptional regulator [Loigolactobacillus iwatensis]|uniref:PadR family transcriptional regulator n=1 Tax=Loigolactobacillus iwatensis TaxID=1267156 RepID=UPI000F7D7DC4|nr:PadR family transcriptional regulator [Loigolactobacillus iwatensis]